MELTDFQQHLFEDPGKAHLAHLGKSTDFGCHLSSGGGLLNPQRPLPFVPVQCVPSSQSQSGAGVPHVGQKGQPPGQPACSMLTSTLTHGSPAAPCLSSSPFLFLAPRLTQPRRRWGNAGWTSPEHPLPNSDRATPSPDGPTI